MLKSGLEINSSQLALLCYHLHRSKLAFSCFFFKMWPSFFKAYWRAVVETMVADLPCIVFWYLLKALEIYLAFFC